eukprot:1416986-Rhodomonas_salina.1
MGAAARCREAHLKRHSSSHVWQDDTLAQYRTSRSRRVGQYVVRAWGRRGGEGGRRRSKAGREETGGSKGRRVKGTGSQNSCSENIGR